MTLARKIKLYLLGPDREMLEQEPPPAQQLLSEEQLTNLRAQVRPQPRIYTEEAGFIRERELLSS